MTELKSTVYCQIRTGAEVFVSFIYQPTVSHMDAQLSISKLLALSFFNIQAYNFNSNCCVASTLPVTCAQCVIFGKDQVDQDCAKTSVDLFRFPNKSVLTISVHCHCLGFAYIKDIFPVSISGDG